MSNPIPLAPLGARHRLIRLQDGPREARYPYISQLDEYMGRRHERAARHPLSNPEFVWNPPRTLPERMFRPRLGCVCSECGLPLREGDELADRYIYEIDGTLDYIELFHASCERSAPCEASPKECAARP